MAGMGSVGASSSSRAERRASRLVRKSEAVSANARWSSVIAIDMGGHYAANRPSRSGDRGRHAGGTFVFVGFLDRAKKLAEQAMDKAQEALNDIQAGSQQSTGQDQSGGQPSPSYAGPPTSSRPPTQFDASGRPMGWGTPYLPGMLGRPGWREQGLPDPAAVLPIKARDGVGVPHSTKSQIVEEPYGMGRRWTSNGRSAGLFYRLYPEQKAWEPPSARSPVAGTVNGTAATLPDGRSLVFMSTQGSSGGVQVVLETSGLDDASRASLVNALGDGLALVE